MRISSDNLDRINRVINFIHENPAENLSLAQQARIANYSPFHFQKLFVEIVGETPKQYIQRIRLETAAHALVMFPHRSITEIALDSGFSSSATFSRAFRNHFAISPQELKRIRHEARFSMYKDGRLGRYLIDTDRYFFAAESSVSDADGPLRVRIERLDTIRGIVAGISLDNPRGITTTFKKVWRQAEAYDLTSDETKLVGALYPHQRLYQAIATIGSNQSVPRHVNEKSILSGKFAAVATTGSVEMSFAMTRRFATEWLPDSGYRIADIFVFEMFHDNPADMPYEEMERDVYIRIEPAR
jgi:AraC family transcriptional regulator